MLSCAANLCGKWLVCLPKFGIPEKNVVAYIDTVMLLLCGCRLCSMCNWQRSSWCPATVASLPHSYERFALLCSSCFTLQLFCSGKKSPGASRHLIIYCLMFSWMAAILHCSKLIVTALVAADQWLVWWWFSYFTCVVHDCCRLTQIRSRSRVWCARMLSVPGIQSHWKCRVCIPLLLCNFAHYDMLVWLSTNGTS